MIILLGCILVTVGLLVFIRTFTHRASVQIVLALICVGIGICFAYYKGRCDTILQGADVRTEIMMDVLNHLDNKGIVTINTVEEYQEERAETKELERLYEIYEPLDLPSAN